MGAPHLVQLALQLLALEGVVGLFELGLELVLALVCLAAQVVGLTGKLVGPGVHEAQRFVEQV